MASLKDLVKRGWYAVVLLFPHLPNCKKVLKRDDSNRCPLSLVITAGEANHMTQVEKNVCVQLSWLSGLPTGIPIYHRQDMSAILRFRHGIDYVHLHVLDLVPGILISYASYFYFFGMRISNEVTDFDVDYQTWSDRLDVRRCGSY